MQIIPVTDVSTANKFLKLPLAIYKNDPNWIQPLDKDILDVFDQTKNKSFRTGKLQRWILQNENDVCIGRIAAFTNSKYKNKGDDLPVGCMGFFECINDKKAANFLLDTAKNWLQNEGMQAMDGPVNFGERDKWWGLVTKGFMQPLYGMNYNPPYYVSLLEEYGFKLFFEQICFGMKNKEPLDKKIWDRHAEVSIDPKFSACHLQKKDLNKYAQDFVTVYNKAWAGHGGLKQMAEAQAIIMFNKMKPIMDEKIIWYAYYDNEPVAIFINLPDLNQWFKYLHGKFGLLQKIKFILVKQFTKNKKFTGLVFGVVPKWQGKGVDGYIIGESAKYIQSDACSYQDYEMQWIGDFNPKMLNVASSLGKVERSRNLCTYRYLFDREKEFVRHPIV
jgi:hypothetical protein